MTKIDAAKEAMDLGTNDNLHQLFLSLLAEMHDAELQLTHALPLVALAAQSKDLKTLLHLHLEETKGHVACIEQIEKFLGETLTKRPCRAMKALVKETVVVMLKNTHSPVLDTAIIAAAQKIEHYEIASYGTLRSWAEQLGCTHAVAKLASTLGQEKIADGLLTGLAKGGVPLTELIQKISLKQAGATRPVQIGM